MNVSGGWMPDTDPDGATSRVIGRPREAVYRRNRTALRNPKSSGYVV